MSRIRPLPVLPALAVALITGVVLAGTACSPAGKPATAPAAATQNPSAATTTPSATPSASASTYPSETVTPLYEQALPKVKGKTFSSIVVDYPPNARSVPHRHGQAFVYAYVLEGTVRSKLDGRPARTYHQGQSWAEQPGAHHAVSTNTSRTRHARLLVVFVSDTGDPLTVPDHADGGQGHG
ncbi:cupin domain-containing protein [Streptomyces sp. NPDC088387]|uniref:cupin domain-containing protein n=1 Tax=Streptomyces sp. NPDC088387 TaxID=3365859 RepID=UPI00381EA679